MGSNHVERPTTPTASATDSIIVPSVAIGLVGVVVLATVAKLLCLLVLLLLLWRCYFFRDKLRCVDR